MSAVDGDGRRLVEVVVRFAGVGGPGVPAGACSPVEGAAVLERALGGRRVLAWTEAQVAVLTGRLERLGHPLRVEVISSRPGAGWDGWQTSVRDRVAQWRGQLDPATGVLLPAWSPGGRTVFVCCWRGWRSGMAVTGEAVGGWPDKAVAGHMRLLAGSSDDCQWWPLPFGGESDTTDGAGVLRACQCSPYE
ncbi:hypothetical protein SHKM778_95250 (plasmid) [Streptomyces sp. KM77-8]|uniref:Uncharacterized protein n=1 Tax=Streptomyces haneummycinicus TaxID=3074435 RepID=A0AAT9HZV2_9ACTN